MMNVADKHCTTIEADLLKSYLKTDEKIWWLCLTFARAPCRIMFENLFLIPISDCVTLLILMLVQSQIYAYWEVNLSNNSHESAKK